MFNFNIWCTMKEKNLCSYHFFFIESTQIKKNSLGFSSVEDNNFQSVSVTRSCNLPHLSAVSLERGHLSLSLNILPR